MTTNPYGIEALWHQGDVVIKIVALLLLLMSVVSWSVIVIRSLSLWRLRPVVRIVSQFWHTQSFTQGLMLLGNQHEPNPFLHLALEGKAALEHHTHHTQDLHGVLPLADWLASSLRAAVEDHAERLQQGLSLLASVGSTAPFIGLFGTVWGIYHALVSIGVSGQASIDKVAGPVGEALIMTAFGLAVAIPAVLGYNLLTRKNKKLLSKLNRFAQQLHTYFLTGGVPKSQTPPIAQHEGK
jgi:biopolymer transport protein ExbB